MFLVFNIDEASYGLLYGALSFWLYKCCIAETLMRAVATIPSVYLYYGIDL